MASAPGAALVAAAFAGGPLLAYWTQTFMDSGSRFVAQFFPIFLLGALFGKLMDDSGSVAAIANPDHFTGTAAAFARAGFKVAARRASARPIMRHDL
jgi:hypothetical protein